MPRFFIGIGRIARISLNQPNQLSKSRPDNAPSRVEHEVKMFAVIKTGGKQYSVAADDEIVVMTLAGEPGDDVTFESVLMLVDGETTKFGAPFVEGAKVVGTIVGHERGPKVLAFKKRRRQNSKRKRGHRQDLTRVKITSVA
jgi:large subunit ribosomal protein L21